MEGQCAALVAQLDLSLQPAQAMQGQAGFSLRPHLIPKLPTAPVTNLRQLQAGVLAATGAHVALEVRVDISVLFYSHSSGRVSLGQSGRKCWCCRSRQHDR
jgi:hypothetical protein